jgi:Uma2 family endonuclease
MSTAASRHRYTFRDYLDVEEVAGVRHEFLDGEIYAMAGGTPEHAALCAALIVLLGSKLGSGPCRVYTSDLRLRVPDTGLATYPDVAVICGPPIRDPGSPSHVTNPIVLFEVLSDSTEDYDRGEKREHYQRMPSVQEYVVVAQNEKQAELWRRSEAGWSYEVVTAGQLLELRSIGASLAIDQVYAQAGLDF